MDDFKKTLTELADSFANKEIDEAALGAKIDELKQQGLSQPQGKKILRHLATEIHKLESEKNRLEAQKDCLETIRDSKNVSIGVAVQKFKAMFPEIWAQVSPRIYKNAESYGDYRFVYLEWAFAHILQQFNNEKGKANTYPHQLTINCFNEQKEHGFPFFFVSKGLCDAAWQSDLKFAVDWKTMRLPFEAFTFIAPKNNPFGEPRIEGAIVYRYVKDSDIHFHLSVLGNGGLGTEIVADYPFEADGSWDANILRWVFNTIYIMAARPEYVEGGNRVGTHKHSQSEIWTPNIIGHKYAVKSHSFTSNERKGNVRLHWRRGHFRQQVFGIKRGKRKVIWIEPMMVGGEKAVSDSQ